MVIFLFPVVKVGGKAGKMQDVINSFTNSMNV